MDENQNNEDFEQSDLSDSVEMEPQTGGYKWIGITGLVLLVGILLIFLVQAIRADMLSSYLGLTIIGALTGLFFLAIYYITIYPLLCWVGLIRRRNVHYGFWFIYIFLYLILISQLMPNVN